MTTVTVVRARQVAELGLGRPLTPPALRGALEPSMAASFELPDRGLHPVEAKKRTANAHLNGRCTTGLGFRSSDQAV